MEKPPRRCYSEYGAFSKTKTSSLVPSHIATKIREAQLRQTHANQLVSRNEKDTSTALCLDTDRHLNSLTFSLRLPKILPSWRTTQFAARKQVDGAETLPTIDTIIADPGREADKHRNAAETEYYEHIDTDGLVRRRSMMRTVNKDDCLTGRGANPRTGLITPDVRSVASSVDSVIEPRQEPKMPSAQWKLKDNQWVSEIQDDEDQEIGSDHRPSRVSETHTQPLTTTNLRSFSQSILGQTSKHVLQSPSTEAILDVGKIRRKPVGSPSKFSSNSSEPHKQRSVSEDTVIRTPPAANPSSEQITSFFSPNDVERVRGTGSQCRPKRNQYDRLPFLDLQAKPYPSTNMKGLASGRKNLMRLERSLRMNDGPYPSPRSTPQVSIDASETRQGVSLPAVPRADISGLDGQHSVKYPETRQNRNLKHERLMIPCQSQIVAMRDQQSILKDTESRRTNLNTSALNSTKRFYHLDTGQMQDDPLSLRRDISRDDVHIIPNGRTHRPHASKRSHGDIAPTKRVAKYRPPLGPRTNATTSPTMSRPKLTRTEERLLSNLTGTPVTLKDEDVVDGSEVGESPELPYPSRSDIPVNLRVPFEQSSEALEVDSHDHSTCCPRCCVEYDCHKGCLGHSPQSEVDKSETSSLISMGVFEANFETSVKAINDVLLTPQDKRGSALTKLRQAFLESLWQNRKTLIREPTKQQPLKRSLRHPSPIRGSPIISGPITSENSTRLTTKQAEAAAQKAMSNGSDIAKHGPKGPRPAKAKRNMMSSRQPSATIDKVSGKNEANEGRKISMTTIAADSTSEDKFSKTDENAKDVIDQKASDFSGAEDAAAAAEESVIAKIGALVLHDRVSKPLLTFQPTFLRYGPTLLMKSKDMIMVVLDTVTVLSCMICDYKRTGEVLLPDNVGMTELMGNCLRSLLYLMIAACLYALLVKVSRVVLCILRILLLPAKLCAWIIG